jgi:hypothetical protein
MAMDEADGKENGFEMDGKPRRTFAPWRLSRGFQSEFF